MSEQKRALLVSYPEPLPAHETALSDAGFAVSAAKNMSVGLGAVGLPGLDLLVLGHTIPPGDRRRIEAEAKRRNPNLKIVLMYEGTKERDIFAQAFVDLADGPAALVATARSLLP